VTSTKFRLPATPTPLYILLTASGTLGRSARSQANRSGCESQILREAPRRQHPGGRHLRSWDTFGRWPADRRDRPVNESQSRSTEIHPLRTFLPVQAIQPLNDLPRFRQSSYPRREWQDSTGASLKDGSRSNSGKNTGARRFVNHGGSGHLYTIALRGFLTTFKLLFNSPELVIISIPLIKPFAPTIVYILKGSIRQSVDFSTPIVKTAVGSALGLWFYDRWQERDSGNVE